MCQLNGILFGFFLFSGEWKQINQHSFQRTESKAMKPIVTSILFLEIFLNVH